MSDKDKAMQQALEALEADELDMVDDGSGNMVFRKEQAIAALRTALEQQAEPVAMQEKSCARCLHKPTWPNTSGVCGGCRFYSNFRATPPLPVQTEPSSECNPQDLCAGCRCKYGAQPPLPVQEPPQYSLKAHWTDDKRIGVVACVTRPDGGVHLLQTIIDSPSKQKPETFERWNAKQHGDPEEIGFLQALRIAYCAGQDSVTTPPAPQRPWQGMTEQDMPSGEDPMFDHQFFIAGMVYAAKVLKAKNT